MKQKSISIYTDGSCNPVHKLGGWASIIFVNNDKVIIKGIEKDTTHQRMELRAVINSIVYLEKEYHADQSIVIYSDSQYIVEIRDRKDKLKAVGFVTKKNIPIRNADLVKKLISQLEQYPIEFVKVKGHQKRTSGENVNREVDMLIRKEIRENLGK